MVGRWANVYWCWRVRNMSEMVDGDVAPVTQTLIQRYYQYIMGNQSKSDAGTASGTASGVQIKEAEVATSESQQSNVLRHRFISNLIRHVQHSQHALDETDIETDIDKVNFDKDIADGKGKGNSNDNANDNDNDDEDEEQEISVLEKFKEVCYSIFIGDYEKDLLIEKIINQKQYAMTFDEWNSAALELDQLTNKIKWKQKNESTLYDYKLIEDVTNKLKTARLNKDYAQLLYTIRTNWVRNLGNMGNVNLYRHSHVGTKFLIDNYMEESKRSLNALITESDLDDNYLIGILQQTRRNIGRTALVLSGGGTFGMFHTGLLSTLFELDLLPRVISGSSAGAIVASIMTVHYKEEIPALLDHIMDMEFNIFKDDDEKSESENFLIKFQRFFKNGTWFDNKHLVNTMIKFLGDLTFREAYNRTGKILNITVSPDTLFEQPRLLNNLTAPNVLIWSAVCASCSLPGIFPSSPLYEKDPITGKRKPWSGSSSVKFVDGSVDNDLPISRLSEMFNVDHIIACQVNVHVFPFLKLSLSCVGGEIEDEFSARLKKNLTKVYNFMANELIHLFELGCEVGLAKNTLTRLRSLLSQQYSGDVTILPDMNTLLRFKQLLSNPTKQFFLRELTNGARATWPKISIIKNHCGQEFGLDKAISYLKGKIIVSSSIRNPLQFVDVPIGLIKATPTYHAKISNEKLIRDSLESAATPFAKDKQIEEISDTNGEDNETLNSIAIDDEEKNSTPIDETGNVLDDNLLETESTNSLLLLRDNANNTRDNSNPTIHTERLSLSSSGRRKSDIGSRPTNNKGFSFYIPPSKSRILRPANKSNSSLNYRYFHHKANAGQIFFPMNEPTGEYMSGTVNNGDNENDGTVTPIIDTYIGNITTQRATDKSPVIRSPLSSETPDYKASNSNEGDTFYKESNNQEKLHPDQLILSSESTGEFKNFNYLRRHSADGKNRILKSEKYKPFHINVQRSASATGTPIISPKSNRERKTSINIANIDIKDGI